MLVPFLTAPSDNADTSTIPDHMSEGFGASKSVQPSVAVEKISSSKSTAPATAELLCGVRDSAGAFSPFKSVASSLNFILDNCKVCPLTPHSIPNAYGRSSGRR